MSVTVSQLADVEAWLNLARSVEHLFGPMAEEKVISRCVAKCKLYNTQPFASGTNRTRSKIS